MEQNGEKTVVLYKNVKLEDIPDSTFELPADVKVLETEMPGTPQANGGN